MDPIAAMNAGANQVASMQGVAQANNAWSAGQAQIQRDWQEQQNAKAMMFNQNEAAKNRNWQEMLSNTAHQREMRDLMAAGLNPVLSAMNGNGASVGSGATAQGVTSQGAKGDTDMSANGAIANLLGSILAANTQIEAANINARTQEAVADKYTAMEKIVAETAIAACQLAGAVDQVASQYGVPAVFSRDKYFGKEGKYSYNSYMHGRQYYYGLSIGAAYKINDHLSAYAGVRGVYALTNYYGYVEDIKVGNMPLYMVLDPTKEKAANIELSCDQSGLGFTPMLGIDFKTGKWNFAAKYEFKTRMRLKNKSVNQTPSIGNLPDNLRNAYITGGVPEQAADAILANSAIQGAMGQLKTQFDSKLEGAIGEYEDGKKIAGDIPAYLAVGVGYSPVDAVRVNVGFHWFDDKNATSYKNRNKELDRGTLEYNAGVEVDINKKITLSTGWQNTNYGLPDENLDTPTSKRYMDDKSFVVGSNSVAFGGVYHINKKMDLNVAYFHTFYQHKKTSEKVQLTAQKSFNYNSDYTRNNNVFAVGLDINF